MNRKLKEIKCGVPKWNITMQHMNVTISREKSMVDEFYFDKVNHPDSKEDIQVITDPIYMLFNQKRIDDTLGLDTFKVWLDQLQTKPNNPLSELRSKCSDEDLLKTIKSRYLQQPCEILAWARAQAENLQEFEANVKEAIEKQTATVETAEGVSTETTE